MSSSSAAAPPAAHARAMRLSSSRVGRGAAATGGRVGAAAVELSILSSAIDVPDSGKLDQMGEGWKAERPKLKGWKAERAPRLGGALHGRTATRHVSTRRHCRPGVATLLSAFKPSSLSAFKEPSCSFDPAALVFLVRL